MKNKIETTEAMALCKTMKESAEKIQSEVMKYTNGSLASFQAAWSSANATKVEGSIRNTTDAAKNLVTYITNIINNVENYAKTTDAADQNSGINQSAAS